MRQLNKFWRKIEEDVGFVKSAIYTSTSLDSSSVPPYCNHIGRRMVCLFCPEYIVVKKNNCISRYCSIAYAKRLHKEEQERKFCWRNKR